MKSKGLSFWSVNCSQLPCVRRCCIVLGGVSMKELIYPKQVGLLLVLLALAFSPVVLPAQDQSGNPASLTLQDVKDRLKQNQTFLEDAQTRGKAGDAAGLQTALDNFSRSTDGLNRALSSGQFNGTP